MSTSVPRPEYPTPQFSREDWHNLNGQWEFDYDDKNEGLEADWCTTKKLKHSITVPFSYQTSLSGIHDTAIHEIVWYARSFSIPSDWKKDCDILLHFGAVDYRSTIWINGQEAGHNQGGHVPFSLDITPYLREGENRIVARVEDRQDPHQPRGKQAVNGKPEEIDYYCTTGIWQTVWLEPVPPMRIQEFNVTPKAESSVFDFTIFLHAPSTDWDVEVIISQQNKEVVHQRQKSARATVQLSLAVPYPIYWSPENPHLYDLTLRLYENDTLLDEVKSYAGLRSVAINRERFTLNGEPRYLAMVLDQGYWPEGGMTAPSDAALKADVEWIKAFGYNAVRKHQKIEDPRWLYWCDKLGIMVWGEMANARAWTPKAEEWLIAEWERAVRRDYNHPCIVSWVPMNESWGVPDLKRDHPGQYAFIERIVSLTRRLDSYRPVIDNDGWEHSDIGDIIAIHDYTQSAEQLQSRYQQTLDGGPLPPVMWNGTPLFVRGSKHRGQPVMLTEVGGFLLVPQQIPADQRDILYKYYGSFETPKELLAKYVDLIEGIAKLPFVAGFCYTQLTDIEQEINGVMSYDRQPKIDPAVLFSLHKKLTNPAS